MYHVQTGRLPPQDEETVQELLKLLLRELRLPQAAAAFLHPPGDGVRVLLPAATAAVRVHADVSPRSTTGAV